MSEQESFDKHKIVMMLSKEEIADLYIGANEAVNGLSRNNNSFILAFREHFEKLHSLESKNSELVKELELYTDKIFELEKHNEMLTHQLKYAESILTEVQADKYKLREKLELACEALEWISKTDTASHVYGPDVGWLTNWRNTRKQTASEALEKIKGK